MATTFVGGVPGVRTEILSENRCVRRSGQNAQYLSGGAIISGSLSRDTTNTGYLDVLRAGVLMGKTTTGGKWRPSILGYSTAAYVDNDLTITVSAACATEVARLITLAGGNVSLKLVGAASDATAGTVVSTAVTCSAASGTTLTVADLNVAKVTGAAITPADGSELPLALIDNGSGVKVTDGLGVSQDQSYGYMLVGGDLDTSQILNWPGAAAVTLIAYYKASLNNASNYGFRFDDVVF